jgi:hypothetical protein
VIFFYPGTQGIAADAQKSGGLDLIPFGLQKSLLNEEFFDLFQEVGMQACPPEPKNVGEKRVELFHQHGFQLLFIAEFGGLIIHIKNNFPFSHHLPFT